MKHEYVTVRLWGREVGRLMWDERKNLSIFQFNPEFLKSGWNVAPLTHPIGRPSSPQAFWGDKGRMYQGLPPFIADSLPDSWGDMVFEQWARENGIKRFKLNPLERLTYLGRRAMGAFEFEPESCQAGDTGDLRIQELAGLAEKIYRRREEMSVVCDEALDMQALYEIGTSAGGRQAKAVIAVNDKGVIRSGQIASPPDFVQCILKFDVDAEYDHPATVLEMVYHDMAVAGGIRMMPAGLISIGDKRHFLTRRFDREGGEKVHVQTLAAMNPEASSYEDLMQTVRRLGIGKDGQTALFRQIAFNFLAGNTDDHQKNFSFLMRKDGIWQIAPAYDLTFTLRSPAREFPHCMSLHGKVAGVTADDLAAFAREEGISSPKTILREVVSGISKFRERCLARKVAPYWIEFIEKALYDLAPEEYKPLFKGKAEGSARSFEEGGFKVSGVRLEVTEKGNVHLYAVVGGREYKYVFGKRTAWAQSFKREGIGSQSEEQLRQLVGRFILPKLKR